MGSSWEAAPVSTPRAKEGVEDMGSLDMEDMAVTDMVDMGRSVTLPAVTAMDIKPISEAVTEPDLDTDLDTETLDLAMGMPVSDMATLDMEVLAVAMAGMAVSGMVMGMPVSDVATLDMVDITDMAGFFAFPRPNNVRL